MVDPVLVASTVVLFGTGVALLALNQTHGTVVGLHKASFIVWIAATGVHVLAYVWRVPRLAFADWRPGASAVSGAPARRLLIGGAVAAGAILAVSTVQYASPWLHR